MKIIYIAITEILIICMSFDYLLKKTEIIEKCICDQKYLKQSIL